MKFTLLPAYHYSSAGATPTAMKIIPLQKRRGDKVRFIPALDPLVVMQALGYSHVATRIDVEVTTIKTINTVMHFRMSLCSCGFTTYVYGTKKVGAVLCHKQMCLCNDSLMRHFGRIPENLYIENL